MKKLLILCAVMSFVALTGCIDDIMTASVLSDGSVGLSLETAVTDGLIISSDKLDTGSGSDYKVAMAVLGSLIRTYEAPVSLYYPKRINLYFENGNGTLTERNVGMASQVTQGDVLFAIAYDEKALREQEEQILLRIQSDEENHASESARLRAEIEQFKNAIYEGMSDGEIEIHSLRLIGMEADYENFLYQYSRRRADNEQELAEVRERMKGEQLLAPFDGIVLQVPNSIRPGGWISRSTMVGVLQDTSQWMLEMREVPIDTLRYGDIITVIDPNGGLHETVVISDPLAHFERAQTQTYILKPLDENLPRETFSGGASFALLTSFNVQEAVLVPSNAVHTEARLRDTESAFVNVYEDGIICKRYVQLGRSFDNMYEILDGLEPGQMVVLD